MLWKDGEDEFIAGTKAEVLILPKDAFGNNVTSASEGLRFYNFTLTAFRSNGSNASVLNVTNRGWNHYGYLSIEFIAATAGSLLLHVKVGNQTFQGSPLPFKVYPGDTREHKTKFGIFFSDPILLSSFLFCRFFVNMYLFCAKN